MLIPGKWSWYFALIIGLSSQLSGAASISSHNFTTTESTRIPGLTLPPGSYSIYVRDHVAGRYVVSVDNPRHKLHYSFLALPNPDIAMPAAPGRVIWNHAAEGKQYLRGWFFADAPSVLEFVYPKTEAVAIAKSNQEKVPAIDPASEGLPVKIQYLTKSDLELVTLWLLSSTRVGPGDSSGGIQAERYRQVASVSHKPVIAKLPQTASNLSLIALLGMFSIMVAIAMHFFRPALLRAG